ncbi:MAG: hypothetical protein O9248_00090 [Rhodobacteraceae bacterium]|nr:hypothetical protein [Paracoccaceae bacterium]
MIVETVRRFLRLGRQVRPAATVPNAVALAVLGATVVRRNTPDPETGAERIVCAAPTLGIFEYHGTRPAAELIRARFPEISPEGAARAARLLAGAIRDRLDHTPRRRPRRRRGWVHHIEEFSE